MCIRDSMCGELLVPLYLRLAERNTASTTLPLSSTTRSFIPHFFSQPFRYSKYVWPSKLRADNGSPSLATTCSRVMPGSIVAGPVSYTHLRAHETGRNLV